MGWSNPESPIPNPGRIAGMKKQLLTAAAVVLCAVGVAGQSSKSPNQSALRTPQSAMPGGVPRMADGHPDLQGTYDLATMTPLERAKDSPLILTPEEAAKRERANAQRTDQLNAPIEANRAAPPKGGDGSPGPYGNVGGYNNFWLDPGSHYTSVDGRKRASLLVDPPDGRVPPLTEAARQRRAGDAYNRPTSDAAAREGDPGF